MAIAIDIMTKNPLTVTPETTIQDAAKLLLEKRFNGLPVVDKEGKVVGVLCQSDLIAQQKRIELPSVFSFLGGYIEFGSGVSDEDLRKITALTVADAMTKDPVTVTPDTPVEEIASKMVDAKYYTLPVVREGKLIGIVGKEDILGTIVKGND